MAQTNWLILKKNNMKVLITGGAGFIGCKLSNKLIELGMEVKIIDNFLPQVHKNYFPNLNSKIEVFKGDIRNEEDLDKVISDDIDYVVHLAAETGTNQSMYEITKHTSTNILGTSLLIEKLNNFKIKKLILTSSRAVYGECPNLNEESNLSPQSIYGLSKMTQEKIIELAYKSPYTILRLQNVFGDGQSIHNPYTGIFNIFVKKLLNNESVEIYDNGLPTRDFIYVDNVVDAIILSLNSEVSNEKIYNVGSGEEMKIFDAVLLLKDILNSKSEIIISNYHREGDILYACGNIEKIKKELDWTPKINFLKGINNFINWFKNNL